MKHLFNAKILLGTLTNRAKVSDLYGRELYTKVRVAVDAGAESVVLTDDELGYLTTILMENKDDTTVSSIDNDGRPVS